MNSKSRFFISCCLLWLIVSVQAGEEVAVWRRLYNQAVSIEHRNAVLSNMIGLDNRDLVPVYQEALAQVNMERHGISGTTRRLSHNQLAVRLVNELGRMRALEAAEEIFQMLLDIQDDAFSQAAAIRALGDINAIAYVDRLSAELNNINRGILEYPSRLEEDVVVTALVYSLERIRHVDGFAPVFYAAIGRYPRSVSDRARQALIQMVEDPTDLLEDILIRDGDFDVKSRVLDVVEASNAPSSGKARLAVKALEQGMIHQPRSIREANSASRLRLDACRVLISNGIQDLGAVPLLDEMIRASYSHMETLTAIETLGTSASDEAATVLVAFLNDLNRRRQSGYTFPNETLVRSTIQALGSTNNQLGRSALLEVEFSGWSGDTRRMARAVLQQLD